MNADEERTRDSKDRTDRPPPRGHGRPLPLPLLGRGRPLPLPLLGRGRLQLPPLSREAAFAAALDQCIALWLRRGAPSRQEEQHLLDVFQELTNGVDNLMYTSEAWNRAFALA